MVSRIGVFSASLVICGLLLFAYGFYVVSLIAYYPIGPSFGGGGTPRYYYYENISGGTPLVSLGIALATAGFLIAFSNRQLKGSDKTSLHERMH